MMDFLAQSTQGNLIGAGNTGYVYDVENRLVGAFGGTTVNLRYDPLGRLYETSGGYLGLTRFLYDGGELVGEYGPTGSMLRRYVHGRGEDDPMIWYEGAGVEATAIRRLRTNHQGSVVAIANNAGAPLAVNAYDDWGLPNGWTTPSAADDNVGRFQYTGQAWISELGMYHYKARFYSVTLGRFMQTDPIGYKDQMNLYAYVGNDPVNGKDPTGKQTVPGSQNLRIEDFAQLRETIKEDPGIILDAAMIVADVVTVPSGEAAAGIALRRGAMGAAERGMLGGLETRGIRPAPGTRVIPKGIPEGWRIKGTREAGGVKYYNPRNRNENVRVMQGNPSSRFPHSQAPYARQQNAAGTYLRRDGTPSPLPRGGVKDPDAHIPLDQFEVQ